MNSAKHIRRKLKSSISCIDSHRNEFCIKPEKDFSRKRKMSFEDTVNFILSMKPIPSQENLVIFSNSKVKCQPSQLLFSNARKLLLKLSVPYSMNLPAR